MDAKVLVLYFTENRRSGASKLVSALPSPPPATALIVIPHRDDEGRMQKPGWYMVELSFKEGGTVAFARLIRDERLVAAGRDLLDVRIAAFG